MLFLRALIEVRFRKFVGTRNILGPPPPPSNVWVFYSE